MRNVTYVNSGPQN